jgi:hypothetical protein
MYKIYVRSEVMAVKVYVVVLGVIIQRNVVGG